MSGIYTRATRQRSKPVVLDLQRTDLGFEIVDEMRPSSISNPKSVISRPEKPLNYSKSLVPRSVDRGSTSPSGAMAQPSDALARSRTTIRPPMNPSPKISINNGVSMPEKSLLGRTGGETVKRELYPFGNLSMRMGGMGETSGANDLNISSHFDKPSGHNLMGSIPPGYNYQKPIERPLKEYPIVIPSCTHWFDLDTIHQIEKDYLPEFFAGKPTKTPETYKRYRNYMITQYRQNTGYYLNATTCRKSLPGDACSIMRIHAFLEHWGLINFHIEPPNQPKSLFVNKPNYTSERLLEFSQKDFKMDLFDQLAKNNSINNETELVDQIKNLSKHSRPLCDFCGLACGLMWYQQKSEDQSQAMNPEQEGNAIDQVQQQIVVENAQKPTKGPRLVLCTKCYSKGNYPNLLSSNDFYKIDAVNQLSTQNVKFQAINTWTQEETVKLLDLILKLGDNWPEIQKNFPHKSKEDLVSHYLQLPVRNITPINILDAGEIRGHEDTPNERIVDQVPTVFGDFSNPVLQHVAVFKNLLDRVKEQKKAKKKTKEEAAAAQNVTDTKVEERSDLEIMNISERAKEEEKSTSKQPIGDQDKASREDVKIEGSDVLQSDKDFDLPDVEKEDFIKGKGEAMIIENAPEEKSKLVVAKTKEEVIRDTADHLVNLQVEKLGVKVDYLEEYEKILMHERKQYDILQQGMITERVDIALKRAEVIRQHTQQQQQQLQLQHQHQHQQQQQHQPHMQPVQPPYSEPPMQLFDPKESSYFGFDTHAANFNPDDILDLAGDHSFTKDSF